MDSLRDREVSGYYLMAFVLPVVAGMLILTAVIIAVEWISARAAGKQVGFKDLRPIAGEVSTYVCGGVIVGAIFSIVFGALPSMGIAWLIIHDVGMPMLKVAAPIATLIGLLILPFFRKKLVLGTDRKAQVWWGILGALLGASCPVIGISLLLRYPYYGL